MESGIEPVRLALGVSWGVVFTVGTWEDWRGPAGEVSPTCFLAQGALISPGCVSLVVSFRFHRWLKKWLKTKISRTHLKLVKYARSKGRIYSPILALTASEYHLLCLCFVPQASATWA